MSPIFKNFRHHFTRQKKVKSYLLYAIGEIILVVIGILIALQVNNWNETRIEQRKITQYAKSLIQDLEGDIEMIDISAGQAKKRWRLLTV